MLHLSKDVIAKAAELAGLGTATMTTQQMGIVTAVQANPEKFASLGGEVVDKIGGFSLNMFGLNLGEVPKLMWPIILVPILAAVFSFAQVFISMKLNPADVYKRQL